MSYQTPVDYPSLPSVSIPSALLGDDLKSFRGGKSTVRMLPASSGASTSPNSSILFNIPAEPLGYIKPNSMVLHGKVEVAQTSVALATWSYAGQASSTAVVPGTVNAGPGGAASLFTRFTLTLPGGAQSSYSQTNHYRNAVLPHALSAEYFNDLRQMEAAGVVFSNVVAAGAGTVADRTNFFTTPIDIPCLTSQQALPMLLMSGGLTLEIVTASINEAFYTVTNPITNYAISELSLVYEVVNVTPEFKSALVAAKAQSPYLIHCNDRLCIGPTAYNGTTRLNIGLGLSSMKGVCFTSLATDALTANLAKPKNYTNNGLFSYSMYNNGQLFSVPTIQSDDLCFAEMNRCLGRINDSNVTSALVAEVNTTANSRRNNYNLGAFLAGSSCETIDDWSFSSQGVPCDQFAIEVNNDGTQDASKWQAVQAPVACNLYLFIFYDSILVINPDGTCQIRK